MNVTYYEALKYGIGQPRTVNVIDNPTARCVCVSNHNPNAVQLHVHHIWPLGMGGPDEADNEILLCPTSHSGVHRLIRDWVRADGKPPWHVRRFFNPYVRDLARRAYEQWVEAGRP